ncbi:MAG TPA: flippase-like domain-containing protein, partial [Anaerolineae bacterium]|nr:flippase-like domain-containing protein [Anaerolineae bacterium]
MFQVNVAAQAANRTFVGGAAGVLIRFAYFFKRGMHSGTYGAVEGIEGGLGFLATCSLFLVGLSIVLASGAASEFRWDVIGLVILGALVLAAAVITIVRRRDWVERAADWIVRGVDRIVSRILRRSIYDPARVRGAVNDFYNALELAKRDPARMFISFLCCVGRLGCDAVALYFAFHALGYDAAPGQVLLIFVVSTSVSTIAAVPGQIGVMEGMLSLMSAAFGIPVPIAVGATLLYRLVSFWLPIPFGYAFAWNLTRKGLV